MNAGQTLALVSIGLLLVTKLLERVMEQIDLQVFHRLVQDHPQLGIRAWFTSTSGNNVGEGRTKAVLLYALLTASARTALISLFASLLGLLLTWVVVAGADPEPNLVELRTFSAMGMFVAGLTVFVVLSVKLITGRLKPNPVLPKGTDIYTRCREYLSRLVRPDYLALYNTTVVLMSVVAILISLGV